MPDSIIKFVHAPCPFCGSTQITNHLSDERYAWCGAALCQGCGAFGPSVGHVDEDTAAKMAYEAWDRRAELVNFLKGNT